MLSFWSQHGRFCEGGNNETLCPAHMDEVISVSSVQWGNALQPDEYVRDYHSSSYGKSVDIAAPGVNIKSIVPSSIDPSGFMYARGSSMACPHASAAAALLKLQNGKRTPKEIETLLKNNAKDIGDPKWDEYFGYGVLDVHGLINSGVSGQRLMAFPSYDSAADLPDTYTVYYRPEGSSSNQELGTMTLSEIAISPLFNDEVLTIPINNPKPGIYFFVNTDWNPYYNAMIGAIKITKSDIDTGKDIVKDFWIVPDEFFRSEYGYDF